MEEKTKLNFKRHITYSFLSEMFTQTMTKELLINMEEYQIMNHLVTGKDEIDKEAFVLLKKSFDDLLLDKTLSIKYLKIDFENFFLFNFGEHIPLWETVYLGRDSSLNSEITQSVREIYLSKGYVMVLKSDFEDHLSNELAFMSVLCKEELDNNPAENISLIDSEINFLEDHICKWVPQMQKLANQTNICSFYKNLINYTNQFSKADLKYLKTKY